MIKNLVAAFFIALSSWGALAQSPALSNAAKLRQIVVVTDPAFAGGAKGDCTTDDTAAFNAAMVGGNKTVFVPPVANCYKLASSPTFTSGIHLLGQGKASHLKFTQTTEASFINIVGLTDVTIEKMRINANPVGRLTGPANAVTGHAILVQNSENALLPRRNWVTIRDNWIDSNGFTAVLTNNAHNVLIQNNYIPATTIDATHPDSCIAAVIGSSAVNVVNNYCEGFRFGVSLSSDGNTNYATTGYVRQSTASGNLVVNTKTNGYCYQFDGLTNSTVTGNVCVMNGGLYGFRLNTSTSVCSPTICIRDTLFGNNTVDVQSNIVSSAFDINGTGDIRTVQFANNSAGSDVARINVNGLAISSGVYVTIDGFSAKNLGNGILLDHNNVVTETRLNNIKALTNDTGIRAFTAYANKANVIVSNSTVVGNTGTDWAVNTGNDLTIFNTPIVSMANITPNTLKLDNPKKRTAPAYGVTVTIDSAFCTIAENEITATNGVAFTVSSPTNVPNTAAPAECLLTIRIKNTSGGALGAVTWGGNYKMSAWTSPATGFSRSVSFKWDGANWIQVGQTGVDVPN